MAVLKTKMQGDSMSIGIAFNAEYDTSRIEHHYLYLNNKLYPTTLINGIVRAELKSEDTKAFIGNVKLTVVIDDIHFGVRKTDVGYVEFKTTPTVYDQSINEGYDLVVTMEVNESATGVSVTILEAFRGYSCYDFYVKYTTDDPVLTEEEWTAAVNQAKTDAETAADEAEAAELAAKGYRDEALGFRNEAEGFKNTASTQAGIATTKAGESEGFRNESLGFRNEAEAFKNTASTKAGEASTSAINAANSAQDSLDYRNAAEQIVSAYFLYNITVAIPLTAGNYYTLTTAIAATPVNVRKLGLVITFADTATTWLTYKFIGADVSGWSTLSNWEAVPSKNDITELTETALRFDTYMETVLDAEIEACISMNGLTGTITRNSNNTYTLI